MMRFNKIVFLVLFISTNSFAQSVDKNYFANNEIQRLSPEAFALQPETRHFHKLNQKAAKKEIMTFLNLIKSDVSLLKDIKSFPELTWENKEKVLRTIFALEIQALGIKAPELVIDSNTIKGEAYFDFDLNHPGTGKVILNPKAIQKDSNPYAALMLLIHETRHSAQLQKAFDPTSAMNGSRALSFRAAFHAQKELASKITSFSDFLTLINEYEAFSFGNFVVGSLTDWKADTLGMGTYASQYNSDQSLKIDLQKLFNKFDQGKIKDSVLEEFNRLEKTQYDLLKAQ